MERRAFVRQGALALLALGLPPDFLTRSLLAQNTASAKKKTLICIFQRGAVDGLSMVTPFGEKDYYARRRSIAGARATRGSRPSPGRARAAGPAVRRWFVARARVSR